jgi:hypothetical protein
MKRLLHLRDAWQSRVIRAREFHDYTSHCDDGVIVAWVQPTSLTPFTVGCTHATNGSIVSGCSIAILGAIWAEINDGYRYAG